MSATETAGDLKLLQRYARDHAEDAFAEIVRRNVNLVYSAALRQVRSPQLAEEVAQSVFADLASNAAKLKSDTVLVAWLYAVTRRTAIDAVRKESRRQLREQIAVEMNAMNADAADWNHIEPLLDEAVAALDDTNRAAVLLRYFENKSLREVGVALGTSDDTAQKRVSRAVERLREFFAKRGVSVGAGGLVVIISANAVQAAPAGLAVTISAAALAGTAATTSTLIATTTKTIAMTTLQKTLVTATVAVLAGAGIYEARQASQLRDQVQTLQQQQVTSVDDLAKLRADNEQLSHLVASAKDQKKLSQTEFNELLKLRGEVGLLRQRTNEIANLKNVLPRQSTQTSSTNDGTEQELVSRAQYEFAGFAEPKATAKSMLWAMSQGDVQTMLASMSPILQSQMQERWKDRTEEEIKAGLLNDNDNKKVTGYRITNKLVVSENEVVLTIFQEGRNKEKKMRLVRVGDEWKFAGTPGM